MSTSASPDVSSLKGESTRNSRYEGQTWTGIITFSGIKSVSIYGAFTWVSEKVKGVTSDQSTGQSSVTFEDAECFESLIATASKIISNKERVGKIILAIVNHELTYGTKESCLGDLLEIRPSSILITSEPTIIEQSNHSQSILLTS